MAEQSYEDEINRVKGELSQLNQERDDLAHKLEQSEKANAALVYSTSHDGAGSDHEPEVMKLQLERAQLLAKINEMGADLERRVREAVAAQASLSEADFIIEKQSRKEVESSLSDALTELDVVKTQMVEQATKTKSGEFVKNEQTVHELTDSLTDLQKTCEELKTENNLLRANLETADKENKATIDNLETKLDKAEKRLRSEERMTRFDAALASEISNLRVNIPASSKGNQKQSHALILRGIDQNMRPDAMLEGKEAADCNSAYIVDMYEYVMELKNSVAEERQLYRDLLVEHEDLLAVLGQLGLEGEQFSVCE